MPKPTVEAAHANIQTIVKLEQEFLERRTWVERLGDGVGSFVGTMPFVLLHVAWFSGWMLVNTGQLPTIRSFDPFPFMLLAMMVSLEGVLLTTFVLMKQNRMSKRAEQRDQLHLQIDLLAEREITRILQILQVMSDQLGVRHGARTTDLEQLSQDTVVDEIARELEEQMPD